MSDEIEKIESEGLSEEDKAGKINPETENVQNGAEDNESADLVESVEKLSEAYSNAVADIENESDIDSPDQVCQDSNEVEEVSAEEELEKNQESNGEEDPQDSSSNDSESQPQDESDDSEKDEVVADDSGSEPSEISTCSVIEAILFAADEPVNARKLVEILNAGGVKEVKQHIKELNKKYKQMGCAFRIEQLAGGYQLLTLSAYKPWLSKLIKVRSESKLTAAAMETLSIIGYKQPIMRVEIENIRGVAAGEMIRQLIEKGLVKIVGRAEELGRPLLYGTTQKFLDIFGLGSLKDLPQPEDQK